MAMVMATTNITTNQIDMAFIVIDLVSIMATEIGITGTNTMTTIEAIVLGTIIIEITGMTTSIDMAQVSATIETEDMAAGMIDTFGTVDILTEVMTMGIGMDMTTGIKMGTDLVTNTAIRYM